MTLQEKVDTQEEARFLGQVKMFKKRIRERFTGECWPNVLRAENMKYTFAAQ